MRRCGRQGRDGRDGEPARQRAADRDGSVQGCSIAARTAVGAKGKHYSYDFNDEEIAGIAMLAVAQARVEALDHRHDDGKRRLRCTDRWCVKLTTAEALVARLKGEAGA